MKSVLMISTGATPQIVTETLWALAKKSKPFIPDELILITTQSCVDHWYDILIKPGSKLDELKKHLNMPDFRIKIEVPKAADNSVVDDLRSVDDVASFGDLISSLVEEITEDPETTLHLSIAGGRKTMSYHAGAAMTLFGRAKDELSHVLVTPNELERCTDFWWPDQAQQTVQYREFIDGNARVTEYSTCSADLKIDLIKTPFYRARRHIQKHIDNNRKTFSEIVEHANKVVEEDGLTINLKHGTAFVGEIQLNLDATLLALYSFLALRKVNGLPAIKVENFVCKEDDPYEQFLQIYSDLEGRPGNAERKQAAYKEYLRTGADEKKIRNNVQSCVAKLRSALEQSLDDSDLIAKYSPVNPLLEIQANSDEIRIIKRE